MWPFNRGDCFIQVVFKTDLTVLILIAMDGPEYVRAVRL